MATRPDSIDPEIAKELLDDDRAVVIDARPEKAYRESKDRVAGAQHVDPGGGAALDEALLALPREKLVIAYCDEPGNAASAQVARRARELGRNDAVYLNGGLAAWKAAFYPTETTHLPRSATDILPSLSDEELADVCRLLDWTEQGPGHLDFDDTRAAQELYAGAVPRETVDRLRHFLELAGEIPVPEDHEVRLANVPEELRPRLGPRDSVLLLRWLTWTEEIPRRQAWWYAPELNPLP